MSYKRKFYKERHQKTIYSANAMVSLVLEVLPDIHSAIDLGCGVGTWLSVLKEHGVLEIQGVDGPWVDKDLLEIPENSFLEADMSHPIPLKKRFDLALSLEVAEHLPEECANQFVGSLTGFADFVLFGAAIPFQGGNSHLNEQWQDYWAELFGNKGYVALDFVRKKIWNDGQIPFWYRQNTLLYVKKERLGELKNLEYLPPSQPEPLAIVHPEIYTAKAAQMASLQGSWRLFKRALKKRFKAKK